MHKLHFYKPDNEDTRATVAVHALAEFANELKIVNAVGPRSSVDAVAAMLRSGRVINALPASQNRYGEVPYKANGKWKTWTHLLGYDTWQLLAMENDPMLMPALTADHFWRVLREPQFTTPVLRQWCEPILSEMQRRKMVRVMDGWKTTAAYCYFQDNSLDGVVSSLIKNGTITLTKGEAG
jgi:hypothetical protein